MVAAVYYTHKHHSLIPVAPGDKVRELGEEKNYDDIQPYPKAEFEEGLRELARDLIVREQQMELLISSLPGLEDSAEGQEERIRKLEEDLKKGEEERKEAVREKERLLRVLDEAIGSIKRPH